MLSLGQQVNVRPHVFDPKQDYLGAMVVEVDFLMKKKLVTIVRLNLLCLMFYTFLTFNFRFVSVPHSAY